MRRRMRVFGCNLSPPSVYFSHVNLALSNNSYAQLSKSKYHGHEHIDGQSNQDSDRRLKNMNYLHARTAQEKSTYHGGVEDGRDS